MARNGTEWHGMEWNGMHVCKIVETCSSLHLKIKCKHLPDSRIIHFIMKNHSPHSMPNPVLFPIYKYGHRVVRPKKRNKFITGWWFQWFQSLWKILVSWDDYSQYMESHKIHVPNHQPDHYFRIGSYFFLHLVRGCLIQPPEILGATVTHLSLQLPTEVINWCLRNSHSWLQPPLYTIWIFNSSPWKITIFKNGKPSISMGHFPWLC